MSHVLFEELVRSFFFIYIYPLWKAFQTWRKLRKVTHVKLGEEVWGGVGTVALYALTNINDSLNKDWPESLQVAVQRIQVIGGRQY